MFLNNFFLISKKTALKRAKKEEADNVQYDSTAVDDSKAEDSKPDETGLLPIHKYVTHKFIVIIY